MRRTVYCKNCYTPLADAPEPKCPRCGRAFDARNPRTYLPRPFPSAGRIVFDVILTTVVAAVAAGGVAFFQATRSSGH